MRRNLFGRATMLAIGLAALMICDNVVADLIDPIDVPGKEYSDNPDETAGGAADSLQNIGWNGDGTTNGFAHDYSGSGFEFGIPLQGQQVDATANVTDELFFEMINDEVPFVVSFTGNSNVYYHDNNGAVGVWAMGSTQINSASPPDDVDGLELWGETLADANNFSLYGDPALGLNPAISVYGYYDVGGVSQPYISKSAVQAALLASAGEDDLNLSIVAEDLEDLDVDAMMIYDQEPQDVSWDLGDTIVFSVAPIIVGDSLLFDGGELFVWENGEMIHYLDHGGVIWNKANNVSSLFGVDSENINALEAIVPEPTSAITGMLGVLAIGLFRVAVRKR